jgi:hypothetical protein
MNGSAFNLNCESSQRSEVQNFDLTYDAVRLYSPTPALTNHSWVYPEMVKISAILGSIPPQAYTQMS